MIDPVAPTSLAEDWSCSSTVTVLHNSRKDAAAVRGGGILSYARSSSSSSSRRGNDGHRVHFNEVQNTVHEEEDATVRTRSSFYSPKFADYEKERWYTRADYERFKAFTLSLAKEIAKVDRKLKNRRQSLCSFEPSPYRDSIEKMFQACCESKPEFERKMMLTPTNTSSAAKQCIQHADFRLGLERLTIKALADDKKFRGRFLVEKVKEFQKAQKHAPAAARAERLRVVSETISRPSRIFARQIAQHVFGDEPEISTTLEL